MQDLPDEVLVAKSQEGDKAAFGELVRRYQGRIYNLALRMVKDPQEAEDVLQKSFLSAYQNIKRFRGEAKFHTWLFRIASNFALMKLRKDRDEKVLFLDEPISLKNGDISRDILDWSNNPAEIYEKEELRRILEKAVAELPDAYRIVFWLRDVEGLSNHDVAKMLNLSLPAVKSRLLRARLKMRDFIAPYFKGGEDREKLSRDSLRAM
jgi:RNA polymerase sigma-70 factor (ECF subfamily)